MFTSYSIDEAREIICKRYKYKLGTESVELLDSHGRVTSGDVRSNCNVPGFKRSTMDGYAVRYFDIEKASKECPITLKLVSSVEMGKEARITVGAGECVYIPTGGMLPEGADSVLIIEDTKRIEGEILAFNKTFKGENIILEDEDAAIGEVVIRRGRKIRPYEIGVLSSVGCTSVEVFKRVKIGILSTGDEIVSPYETPKKGQVRDINTYLLSGLVTEGHCEPVIYNIKTDIYEEIYEATKKAIDECDILLISGGSSVGIKDYTRRILEDIEGSEILFHGLSIKPGKPTIAALCNNKLVFGMPGHPLSSAIIYKTLVKSYVDFIMDYKEEQYPIYCELTSGYKKAKMRSEYIPVTLEDRSGKLFATPIIGKSGIISIFSKAYGYFISPKELEYIEKDEIVGVFKL